MHRHHDNRVAESDMLDQVTARILAGRAGVSVTTVSRVLKGKVEAISNATYRRVLIAAQKLEYRPTALAMGLCMGTTRTSVLSVPDLSDAYVHLLARRVEDTAQADGSLAIICTTDRFEATESTYLDLVRDRHVDGIIFAGGGLHGDERSLQCTWGKARLVTIGPHCLGVPSNRTDDRAAIAAAVQHLARQGCIHIACLGGRPHRLVHQARIESYRLDLRDDTDLVWMSDFTVESGEHAIAEALNRRLHVDGIVAFDDDGAYGAIRALQRRGLAVPADVALVGCATGPTSSVVARALTGIAVPLYALGATVACLSLQMVRGLLPQEHVVFPVQIPKRASSVRAYARRAGAIFRMGVPA